MRLRVKTPTRTFEYEAPEGKSSIVIGNRLSDDLCIDDDYKISGPHTLLERTGEQWAFTDQMSDKGTIYNGDLQPSGNLNVGDVLQLGGSRIDVLPEDAPRAPVPTQAEAALAAELLVALAHCSNKTKANSHLTGIQHERELRELAQKAVAKGSPERVRHIWMPLSFEGDQLFYEIEEDINGEGEIDEDDLTGKEKDIVDFIMRRFGEKSGIDIRHDCLARTRVGYASEDASEELDEKGFAEISLPYLGATVKGPQHFCARLERMGSQLVVKEWRTYQPPAPPGIEAGDTLYFALEAQFKSEHKREYLDDETRRAVAAVARKMRSTLSPDTIKDQIVPMLLGQTPHEDARVHIRKLNEEIDAELKAGAAGEDALNVAAIERFRLETGIDIQGNATALKRLRDELRAAYTLSLAGAGTDFHVSSLAKDAKGWHSLDLVVVDGKLAPPRVLESPKPQSTLINVLQWIAAILIIAGTITVMILMDL